MGDFEDVTKEDVLCSIFDVRENIELTQKTDVSS